MQSIFVRISIDFWFDFRSQNRCFFKSKNNTIKIIEQALLNKKASDHSPQTTVILNSYRRPYNLKKQIKAIREQTIPPKEIWLWINDHEDNRNFDHTKLDVDKIFHNNHNWKFYGRFAAALLADTKYVAIFDDDTIPGELWLENCLRLSKEKNCIVGANGRIIDPNFHLVDPTAQWQKSIGGTASLEEDTLVDFVGHCWFFK